jgi:hypothetical protein
MRGFAFHQVIAIAPSYGNCKSSVFADHIALAGRSTALARCARPVTTPAPPLATTSWRRSQTSRSRPSVWPCKAFLAYHPGAIIPRVRSLSQ